MRQKQRDPLHGGGGSRSTRVAGGTTDRLSDAVVELVGKRCPGAAEESGQ